MSYHNAQYLPVPQQNPYGTYHASCPSQPSPPHGAGPHYQPPYGGQAAASQPWVPQGYSVQTQYPANTYQMSDNLSMYSGMTGTTYQPEGNPLYTSRAPNQSRVSTAGYRKPSNGSHGSACCVIF